MFKESKEIMSIGLKVNIITMSQLGKNINKVTEIIKK